ncbi:MAG TPA: type II secretion system F family protein [Planctomycetaceae bacterium]|nr:type II secretion system F family protein [Planctomycetaceae bacterium]
MSVSGSNTVSLEQLVALNDEIAALVRAGVPLELGLRELGGEAGGALGEISTTLAARMQAGISLPEALRADEGRFPPVYRTIVEAGLRAGKLSAALEAMSNFARELTELRRQIGAALVYPLIVFALAYGLFLVFTVDLVERFREAYETFRLPLHGALAVLVWLAERVDSWWWVPPALVAGLIVWWLSTGGAHVLSFTGSARPLAWLPGLGKIGRYFQYANFAELLALLVEHQVPLPEGLRLAADATCDLPLRQAAGRMAAYIEQGGTSPPTGTAATELPPFLDWVLWQAARGANPVRLLRHAAGIYRRRAVNLTNWFKLTFPMVAAVMIGGGITFLYSLALFGPLSTFWKDLLIE